MQIQLKQREIEAALQQYLASRGIAMAGKSVEIRFTAGRKGGGLTADVSVEDLGIPDLGSDDVVAQATPPVLQAVVHTMPARVEAGQPSPAIEDIDRVIQEAPVELESEPPLVVKTTTSLFG